MLPAVGLRFVVLPALWIGAILAQLDFVDQQIGNLSETGGEQIGHFETAVRLL